MGKKVIVCGSRFGQFYIEALKQMKEIEIVGLLARGSERSRACSTYYKIPLYTTVDEVPEIDLACIAVKTSVLGGQGTALAEEFLRRKINVLLEQPIHYKELGECYKIAKINKVYFGLGNLYLNLPAVKNFLDNIRLLKATEPILYVNIELATQVSYPVISILGEVLGTLRPWNEIGVVNNKIPFQTNVVEIDNVPVTFRAHNEIDKTDIDGFLHLLFQITVGYPGGRLSLLDPHGPVIWFPRIHFPKDEIIPGNLNNNSPLNMQEENYVILYNNQENIYKDIFTKVWPSAISGDIGSAIKSSMDNINMQKSLNNSQAWQMLMKNFGYPEIVNKSIYNYYPVEKLFIDTKIGYKLENSLIAGMAVFNNICLKTMYFYLQCSIKERNKGYTYEELLKEMQVMKKFEPIIHRWINVLSINNYIRFDKSKIYFDNIMNYSELERMWSAGEQTWNQYGLGEKSTYDYFKNNALRLLEIMRGEMNPTLLLFPNGQMEIATDLYSNTAIALYYNEIIAKHMQKQCERYNKCRILEVGGGTAATTKSVLKLLKVSHVEKYVFSDVSEFFINHAQKLFQEIPFMDYLKLDINSNFNNGVIKDNSIDILLAVGVLNNAKNIENTLKYIRKILKNTGQAIIVEAIGESVPMLISQAFMMEKTTDERNEKNETFLTLEQWHKLFQEIGFIVKESLPTVTSDLSVSNQKLFILECK